MSSVAHITVDPIADGPGVAAGLRDTAAVCHPDQAAIAARMLIAAHVIESLHARVIAEPDLLALAHQCASECGECDGTGLVTITTWPGGIEVDNDDQPCPDCADIRAVIAKAVKP